MGNTESNRLMAAALYEIRCQLGMYLGKNNESDTGIRLAAHLAYVLHNEALAIIDDIPGQKIDILRENIVSAEKLVGSSYADVHGILKEKG